MGIVHLNGKEETPTMGGLESSGTNSVYLES